MNYSENQLFISGGHSVFLYPDVHSSCKYFCSSNEYIECVDIYASKCINRTFSFNVLIIVFQGTVKITTDVQKDPIVISDSFFTLAAGTKSEFLAIVSSVFLIISLQDVWQICPTLSFEKLFEEVQQSENEHKILTLPVNKPLLLAIDSYFFCTKAGLNCSNYRNLKLEEILYIIRGFYSQSELAGLFGLFTGEDTSFRTFIYRNYKSVWSVDRIASLAIMTKDGFIKKFKRVFGITPGVWLASQKVKMINYELTTTIKPFKEIAFDYGFSHVCSFSTFCKKNMGATPSEIRENAGIPKK